MLPPVYTVSTSVAFYRRRLPHWHPGGKFIFLTWRLFGSLPKDFKTNPKESAGRRFCALDTALDRALHGPRWLADEAVARMVVDSLRFCEHHLQLFRLSSWVLMPNHVHLLIFPLAPPHRITHSLKSFTAVKANQILNRAGDPFWQDESFDHWIRDRIELEKIQSYIENNPVKARMVQRPEDWPWSSASGAGFQPAQSKTESALDPGEGD